MPSLEPYPALYFFAADDTDEVNRDYKLAYEDGGFLRRDIMAELLTVVACEVDRGSEYVWALRSGRLVRLDSWMVRKHE